MTAIILARDERPSIARAVRSVGWCRQVVVVDSGSTDGTQDVARCAGAEVWEEPWRGFAGQRAWVLHQPAIRHDWVFFLDADEWVPADLAADLAARVGTEDCAAYAMRRRLVFQGRWIAHCGWYVNSWQVRVMDRRRSSFDGAEEYGERAAVRGHVIRLALDFVDEDAKGLPAWLRKHVTYAELEARRRGPTRPAVRRVLAAVRDGRRSTRPLSRTIAKEVIFPLVPVKPLAIFLYMYVVRSGWRDGRVGLLFCLYHAWYQLTVAALLRAETGTVPDGLPAADGPRPGPATTDCRPGAPSAVPR